MLFQQSLLAWKSAAGKSSHMVNFHSQSDYRLPESSKPRPCRIVGAKIARITESLALLQFRTWCFSLNCCMISMRKFAQNDHSLDDRWGARVVFGFYTGSVSLHLGSPWSPPMAIHCSIDPVDAAGALRSSKREPSLISDNHLR